MSEWDWTTKRDCENTRNILLSRCDGVDVPPTLVAEGVSTLNSDTKKKKKTNTRITWFNSSPQNMKTLNLSCRLLTA